MKYVTTSNLFIIAILTIILASCSTDNLVLEEPEIIFPDPVELIESSLLGSVEDEAGLPISDALVTCHSCLPVQEVMTDEKGDFRFLNVEVKGGSAYLSVNSSGKFDGFRRVALLEKRVNYTRILLKEKVSLGRLSASEGGDLSDNNGAVISLPANGIVDATGQSYSGDYDVFMFWIDPTSEDLNLRMVGDLSAIDSEGELVGLSTFGMLQVELEGTDGSQLNLSEGSTAILEFPLPQSLRTNAPTVIPLWNYDETNGYWVEDGSAILDDDKYAGEVSHFSTWNVDVKFDAVDICGSIVTGDFKNAPSYFQVRLEGDSFQGTGGWLCDDGSFRFTNVPSGEVLSLEILNLCGELIETLNLGPYEAGKINLGSITLSDDTEIIFVNVTGNAVDCNEEALNEGSVKINLENNSYLFPLESDGSFDVRFPTCAEFEATVQVFNFDDLSTSISIAISNQTPDYNLKNIQACGILPEEYFYYKYVGETLGTQENFLINPADTHYGGNFSVNGLDSLLSSFVIIEFEDKPEEKSEQLGTVNFRHASMSIDIDIEFEDVRIKINSLGPEWLSTDLHEYIEGSFEASGKEANYIIGSFRSKLF